MRVDEFEINENDHPIVDYYKHNLGYLEIYEKIKYFKNGNEITIVCFQPEYGSTDGKTYIFDQKKYEAVVKKTYVYKELQAENEKLKKRLSELKQP